jgi:peptidoglycan/LPS O-acetylase OafA/YrhL
MYYIGICYYLFQDGFGPRYWLGDANHISALNILSNITFLHGCNPYWISSIVPGGWSITVEMTFYALLPFLFSRIQNINQAFNWFIISIIIRLALYLLLFKLPVISSGVLWGDFLYVYFPNQFPIFILGIIMYFIVIERESVSKISGKSLLIFSTFFLCQLLTGKEIFFPKQVLFGIGFLIFAIAISRYKSKFIINSIITYIGTISYSMYLVHFAILYWLQRYNFVDYASNGI